MSTFIGVERDVDFEGVNLPGSVDLRSEVCGILNVGEAFSPSIIVRNPPLIHGTALSSMSDVAAGISMNSETGG